MKKTIILLLNFLIATSMLAQKKEFIYVGTYSSRGSQGVYVLEFDRKAGTLKEVQTTNLHNPSFIAIHPSGKYLYVLDGESENTGLVASFSIDRSTGKITLINRESAKGNGTCHVNIDKDGKWLYASNYLGGSVALLPVNADGSIAPASDFAQYTGSSINKERQDKPYIHSTYISPGNKYAVVSDLGSDKVNIYSINIEGKLKPAATPYLSVAPGAGPRHVVFHPNGKYFYLAEEMYSAVGVFSFDEITGNAKLIQDSVKSLPANFTGKNSSADIHTDPSGKFLYLSNRGLDALSIFSIKDDGMISLIGHQEVLGKTPRNFLVDPKGEFVFVANQNSDNIVIFRMDKKTGMLKYTGNQIKVPAPVCLKMLGN